MLSVSDYFRFGALRIAQNGKFLATHNKIPTLLNLNALAKSSLNVENEEYTNEDIEDLLNSGSSIGGARPKASVIDNNELYIAKFSSKNDEYYVILWEKSMLDLSNLANIKTAKSKLVNGINNQKILLIKRFDREGNRRIPCMSAMSLLGAKDGEDKHSYVDFANKLDGSSKKELYARMMFNALFGNTDDHLRNHSLMRVNNKWILSPNYDLNPTQTSKSRQFHALKFDNFYLPELPLLLALSEKFELSITERNNILKDILNASYEFENIVKNGIKTAEINQFAHQFKHCDLDAIKYMLNPKAITKKQVISKINNKSNSTYRGR